VQPLRVEFTQEHSGLVGPLTGPRLELVRKAKQRNSVISAVVVVLGAMAEAFIAQRFGLSVGSGLCLFVASLPVLLLFGYILGAVVLVRTAAGEAGKLAAVALQNRVTSRERITLEVRADALEVTRQVDSHAPSTEQHEWKALQLVRPGADRAVLASFVGHVPVEIPASAFASSEAFDAFCLAVQERIWAAQRS
jgi:hypothetical protein